MRAGWLGLIVGGASLILPAMLIVMALASFYTTYGSTPQADALLYGVKLVVIAIIAQALWIPGRRAEKNEVTTLVGLSAFALYFLSVNEILLLLAGALIVMVVENARRLTRPNLTLLLPLSGLCLPTLAAATPFSLPLLFFTFLKIGAVLYGSGYVLLAFLRCVNRRGQAGSSMVSMSPQPDSRLVSRFNSVRRRSLMCPPS